MTRCHMPAPGLPTGPPHTLAALPPPRIWLDMGSAESPGAVPAAGRLRDALTAIGWPAQYSEAEGAAHTETAWAQRFPAMLKFLYGSPR